MHLGEICLLTGDVLRLAAFYRTLLQTEGSSDDTAFQAIVEQEPMLTILYEAGLPEASAQRTALAFTVEDMEAVYRHVQKNALPVLQPPTRQPWGTVNMILQDPDGNRVYLRQFAAKEEAP